MMGLPMGVKAHSTRSVAASKALLTGVPIQDICNTAGWFTPLKFFGLDMQATTGSSVLSPWMCSSGIHNGQRLESLAAWASRPQCVLGHSLSSRRGTSLRLRI